MKSVMNNVGGLVIRKKDNSTFLLNKTTLLKTVLCCLFISISSYASVQCQSTFFNYFESEADTLFIQISEGLFLGTPAQIKVSPTGEILWGEQSRFHIFNSDGEWILSKEAGGRGPGEFTQANSYIFDKNGDLYLHAITQFKIIRFKAETNYSEFDEISIPVANFNKFTVTTEQIVGLLMTKNQLSPAHALTVLGKDGESEKFGDIPNSAVLQHSITEGGGISNDQRSRFFYSYLGDHRIWAVNYKNNNEVVFSEAPEYYTGPESGVIQRLSGAMERVQYAFRVTRNTGLFYLQSGFLIQQFEPDNYLLPGSRQRVIIEIWSESGNKIATGIEIPQLIADAASDNLFILAGHPAEIAENAGKVPLLISYQIKRIP